MNPHYLSNAELRRRLGIDPEPEIPYDWIALREAYRGSLHFPLQLHKGHNRYEVLTVKAAIAWAENRARFWLD